MASLPARADAAVPPVLRAAIRRAVDGGNLATASWLCQHALTDDPADGEILFQFGRIADARGQTEAALRLVGWAAHAAPEAPNIQLALGLIGRAQGRWAMGEAAYRRLVALCPDAADAYYNLGNLLFDAGRRDAATTAYRRALRLRPTHADALYNLAVAERAQERPLAARRCLHLLLALEPTQTRALHLLALVERDLSEPALAVRSLLRAAAMAPEAVDLDVCRALALHLEQIGRYDEAAAVVRIGLARAPQDFPLLLVAANIKADRQHTLEAMEILKLLLRLDPADPQALNGLGVLLQMQARVPEAVTLLERAHRVLPTDAAIHSNLLMILQYRTDLTPAETLAAHRAWDSRHRPAGPPLVARARIDADPFRRLRIGYVSGDFGQHPIGFFLGSVIPAHRRTHVDVICYSDRPREDALTEHIRRSADAWVDCRGRSDDWMAERVLADRIDILVDLAGHTARNRLKVFALKPAPVQATWAGYVGTTGLSAMDYLISDNRHTPPGVEPFYSETIIRLPDGYVCYMPSPCAPPVSDLPFTRRGWPTFGSANNLAKINPEVVALWARLLRRHPRARLALMTHRLADGAVRDQLRRMFEDAGVAGEQLDLRPGGAHAEVLAFYRDVDIALDPFPYSGGLTTLEALWMGVPVVTLGGPRFCSRHSVSHLTSVGLTELIARDPNDFLAIIDRLVADPDGLADLRRSLRPRMAASPLCDARRFTDNLEAAYRQMWHRWCALQG